jgi:ATP-dependent helicase/nuclease subunit A
MNPSFMTDVEKAAREEAIDPSSSAFVRAHAGSGKTTILTRRIMRLLLSGIDASQILALTYTKAAAAEMQARVFDQLGSWVTLDDAALDEAITTIGGKTSDAAGRKAARRLFAEALEAPGGLKIQTIHAFCESLLHLFPFEANVPARFEVLDDLERAEIMAAARNETARFAMEQRHSLIGTAMHHLAQRTDQKTLNYWITRSLVDHHEAVISMAATQKENGALNFLPLRLELGLAKDRQFSEIDEEIVSGGIRPEHWPGIAAAFERGSANDIKSARTLRMAIAQTDQSHKAARYSDFFLIKERTPVKNLGTSSVKDDALKANLVIEKERVYALIKERVALERCAKTEALFCLADDVRRRFTMAKVARGVLDFDDIIQKTETLLQRAEARWILYKLDSRITHLLVDEAQDTAPRQWSILKKLTDDFFDGAAARPAKRTIFAVGDEKQSIYSFQGASPEAFGEAEDHYSQQIKQAGLSFKSLELKLSFRTTADVLGAVDETFGVVEDAKGLSRNGESPVHETARHRQPGFVEIWPAIAALEKDERKAWEPLDGPVKNDPAIELAKRIARMISLWIRQGHRFDNDGARIKPGDIMILARKRGTVFKALLRELKREGVPVAGADRLKLNDHIAIEDLFVLADVVLNREDDLALATLLKSPLIGLDDDDLIALTEEPGEISLADRLDASQAPEHQSAAKSIQGWRIASRQKTPFAFYSDVLSADGGRRRFLARLGPDAAEALDVFLADVLDWQRRNPPSLAALAMMMRGTDREVKREMSEASDTVRIMTVHAAKGLEARIVILADTFSAPNTNQLSPLVMLKPQRANSAPIACLTSGSIPMPEILKAQRDLLIAKEEAEYRRLLYVAMTRARDRLYVTGFMGAKSKKERTWFGQVERRLADHASMQTVMADDGEGEVLRFRINSIVQQPARDDPPSFLKKVALPAWIDQPVMAKKPVKPPLRPSNLQDAAAQGHVFRPAGDSKARLRGILVHALLEKLPAVPAAQRNAAALAYLAIRGLAPNEAEALYSDVATVLRDPAFAALFGEKSRAEAAIAGTITLLDGSRHEVRGRIDRIAVMADRIICVDYKTGLPTNEPDISMIRQLALYHRLLGQIYPGRKIEAGILWTVLPRLDFMSSSKLEEALALDTITQL